MKDLLSVEYGIHIVMKQTQMYTCTFDKFISSRCSHVAVQVEYNMEWNLHWFIDNLMNRHEKCENTIGSHLTGKRSENYIQLRNCHFEI